MSREAISYGLIRGIPSGVSYPSGDSRWSIASSSAVFSFCTGFPAPAQTDNPKRTAFCPFLGIFLCTHSTQSMIAWDWLLPVPRTLNKRTSQTKTLRHSSTRRHRPDTPTDRRAVWPSKAAAPPVSAFGAGAARTSSTSTRRSGSSASSGASKSPEESPSRLALLQVRACGAKGGGS